MKEDQSVVSDQKMRWGGFLEKPFISKTQRLFLDGGKVRSLGRVLKRLPFETILEVGCGLGENSQINKGVRYTGLDNSLARIQHAAKKYPARRFIAGDAFHLSFDDKSFDASLLANTSHHLSDEEFRKTLLEMMRVTRRYVIIDDAVRTKTQNRLSTFFYSLDRGRYFRYPEAMRNILCSVQGLKLLTVDSFRTFPGIYTHSVFVLETVS